MCTAYHSLLDIIIIIIIIIITKSIIYTAPKWKKSLAAEYDMFLLYHLKTSNEFYAIQYSIKYDVNT